MSSEAPRPYDFHLEHDAWGRLVLVDPQRGRFVGVVPVRAFPMSDPQHSIAICDAEGHETLWIEDLADVPPETRRVLEEELAQREFVPVIQRVLSATHEEPSQWQVETNRGPASFQVSSEDDVRRIEPAQATVVDSHGVRYHIPDIRRLDRTSQKLLDHFL